MVANSCPCFLHVASRSLSNALFLPLAPRRQMWPSVNTSGGTYMDALPRALEPCSMGGAQDKVVRASTELRKRFGGTRLCRQKHLKAAPSKCP